MTKNEKISKNDQKSQKSLIFQKIAKMAKNENGHFCQKWHIFEKMTKMSHLTLELFREKR